MRRNKAQRKGIRAPGKSEGSAFETYLSGLPGEQAAETAAFFDGLARHCALAKKDKDALRRDFENALLWYDRASVPPEIARARLDIRNLGGFYARPPVLWYALDDAAKIYPLSMRRGQMAVFRLSVCLREPVVPELLQMALTFTVKRFPSFATTVKKGFFWHYLDASKRRYTVERETEPPCRPLRIARSGSQTFRVLYYGRRISVEYFHILTDGTGGMVFLKTLTAQYLALLGHACRSPDIPDINAAPSAGETENAFCRAELSEGSGGFVDRPAVQMSGSLSAERPCRVLHFKLDSAALKAAAQSRGATVTAYILSRMFLAGASATDGTDGEMNIQVPVNMRKFYPSDTVRNFALYCGVRLPLGGIRDEPALLENISAQLAEKASKEAMGAMMSSSRHLVSALRYIPLAVKAPAARVVYGFLGDRIFSNTLSNLGVVRMPPELAAHIESMDFVLGTALTNRAACSLVTFGGVATLSIAKLTADPSFEETLFDLLSCDGVVPDVEGSPIYDG